MLAIFPRVSAKRDSLILAQRRREEIASVQSSLPISGPEKGELDSAGARDWNQRDPAPVKEPVQLLYAETPYDDHVHRRRWRSGVSADPGAFDPRYPFHRAA